MSVNYIFLIKRIFNVRKYVFLPFFQHLKCNWFQRPENMYFCRPFIRRLSNVIIRCIFDVRKGHLQHQKWTWCQCLEKTSKIYIFSVILLTGILLWLYHCWCYKQFSVALTLFGGLSKIIAWEIFLYYPRLFWPLPGHVVLGRAVQSMLSYSKLKEKGKVIGGRDALQVIPHLEAIAKQAVQWLRDSFPTSQRCHYKVIISLTPTGTHANPHTFLLASWRGMISNPFW